jgi:oligoribonuclease NrnB/cAMP/cGMP phosphodiesterase (DHH superfamily)
MTTPTTAILYHSYDSGPCPDGHWAAWVAKKKYPAAEVIPVVYGAPLPIIKADHIVIVDFSFPASQLMLWQERGHTVTLIDHHKTALNDLSGLMNAVVPERKIIFDMEESGATLTWKTFFPDKPMPPILNYIKDRDLWKFKLPYTHEVHAATSTLLKDFNVYETLATLSEEEIVSCLTPIGKVMLEVKQRLVEDCAARHKIQTVAGYDNIPTVFLDNKEAYLTSDICQFLYLKYPDALFTACITQPTENVIKVSMRSNKDGNNTDVSAIAKELGGGGHNNSAGYEVTIQ